VVKYSPDSNICPCTEYAETSLKALKTIATMDSTEYDVDWWIEQFADDTNEISKLHLRAAQLRSKTHTAMDLPRHNVNNIKIVVDLVRQAEVLDSKYSDWFRNLPYGWVVTEEECQKRPMERHDASGSARNSAGFNILGQPFRQLRFSEYYVAVHYLGALSNRLYIWDTYLRGTAWLTAPRDYKDSVEFVSASAICSSVIRDIVSAVPYFINSERDGPIRGDGVTAKDAAGLNGLAAVSCLWPLFSAACSDFASVEQSDYLCKHLTLVVNSMGLKAGRILADVSNIIIVQCVDHSKY
jgi:hypothetical protein